MVNEVLTPRSGLNWRVGILDFLVAFRLIESIIPIAATNNFFISCDLLKLFHVLRLLRLAILGNISLMPFVLRAYLSIRIADHDGVQRNQIFGQSQRFGQFSTTFFRGVSPRSHSVQLYAGGSQENISRSCRTT